MNQHAFVTDKLLTQRLPSDRALDLKGPDIQGKKDIAIKIGIDLKPWEERMQSLINAGTAIITLRGAGSVNGIKPEAEAIAVAQIRDALITLRHLGVPIALMYDGDGDNRAKPDVGSVFGQLADHFASDPGVVTLAAQCESWYSPSSPEKPLTSVSGTPYETFIFSDALHGAHASLTQSSQLVQYENYSQLFIGPVGPIATSQLRDVSDKSALYREQNLGPVTVALLVTPINPELTSDLENNLRGAAGNPQLAAKIAAKIQQRSDHPYGFLCTTDGQLSILEQDYPGIKFDVSYVKDPIQAVPSVSVHQEPEVDVLHAQHPDVLNAVSVLTCGSSNPGTAFRQSADFSLKKASGAEIGGKAGDYILVFRLPDGVAATSELIEQIKESGIPSKDYWISIIDGNILNASYSLEPLSEKTLGTQGLSYNGPHQVYKAAGLKQKALIPSEGQTEVRSLESAQVGTNQSVDSNELVLLDVEGNPYPKWASQFVAQFKPDPSDPRSEALFSAVRAKYNV